MTKSKRLVINTLLLTAAALIMRGTGMVFQAYVSRKIGPAGIGLSQLIMSVSVLAATFAVSGVRFAAMRLVSEELGRGEAGNVAPVVRRCLAYAAVFGTAAAAALLLGADHIGRVWIKDARTILSLRLFALSLPFLATSSVMSGYFTAVCRVFKSAAVQLIEQLVRICVIVAFFSRAAGASSDIETACAVIVLGGAAGDLTSFLLQFALYLVDSRRYRARAGSAQNARLTRRMLVISLPLAVSSYARTALSTLQNLLIPRQLQRAGISAEGALAGYGTIQGMVFPVITFPSAFFYALADMLVPQLTEAQVSGDRASVSATVNRSLRLCFTFSLLFAAMLFFFSGELGYAVYRDAGVGRFIRMLAPLMPIMYLDSVTDGMLRGLGLQAYSMRYNVLDSLLCVMLIFVLLPRFAVTGYVSLLYISEIFNFSLSISRLHRTVRLTASLPRMARTVAAAVGAVNAAVLILRAFGTPLEAGPLSLTVHILFSLVCFAALAALLRCFDGRDLKWLKMLLK